jgi:hypothetical protein
MRLTTTDHDRDSAGLTYVYPVVSRRARGLSVGINLNPNNACNWRCAYCQVPGLERGKGPPIDLERLDAELHGLLSDVVAGDFLQRRVPEGSRRLNDIAFSGNGEPTSSPDFPAAVEVVAKALDAFDLRGQIKVVLITNGSLADQPHVGAALERLAELGGEVWFKFDAATKAGLRATNDTAIDPRDHLARLRRTAGRCPTWVQTCMFARDGQPPSDSERAAYLSALGSVVGSPGFLGVLLYGLARPSHQPEAPTLSALPAAWLHALATDLESLGVSAQVSV